MNNIIKSTLAISIIFSINESESKPVHRHKQASGLLSYQLWEDFDEVMNRTPNKKFQRNRVKRGTITIDGKPHRYNDTYRYTGEEQSVDELMDDYFR